MIFVNDDTQAVVQNKFFAGYLEAGKAQLRREIATIADSAIRKLAPRTDQATSGCHRRPTETEMQEA